MEPAVLHLAPSHARYNASNTSMIVWPTLQRGTARTPAPPTPTYLPADICAVQEVHGTHTITNKGAGRTYDSTAVQTLLTVVKEIQSSDLYFTAVVCVHRRKHLEPYTRYPIPYTRYTIHNSARVAEKTPQRNTTKQGLRHSVTRETITSHDLDYLRRSSTS